MNEAMAKFDVVVVGGGPSGATAAADLARRGLDVLMLDRENRIKPCGGAIPPRMLEEFAIPHSLLVNTVEGSSIVSPSGRRAAMPIERGFVGMVDRETFDPWLRERAAAAGARRRAATYLGMERDGGDGPVVRFRHADSDAEERVRTRIVIGADGANSAVARESLPAETRRFVAAYHEIVSAPPLPTALCDPDRCDVYYEGALSPDFYAWVFPHGDTVSIGVGSACKGFSLRGAVQALRQRIGLESVRTVRCEGAPLPLEPKRRWDNARDVVLAGDAAGVVAPASGEGIYYAALSGRLAAEAAASAIERNDARELARARKRFMKLHGRVFWMLGLMQRFWYSSDGRRERFVTMCRDPDVQRLTWEAYMHKRLVRTRPAAHVRIFVKDMAHLLGIVPP